MNTWIRRSKLWLAAASGLGAAVALAGGVPRTDYKYDNNGNLHGTSVTVFDPACNSVVSTVEMCGSCTNRCPVPTNGTPTCAVNCGETSCSGTCDVNCNTGYTDCSNSCVDIRTDTTNCGGCGVVCSANHVNPACVSGSCGSGTCAAGYADCNANKQTDGCETNIFANPKSCGGCGIVCSWNHIAAMCVGGSCDGTCAAGYADCNANRQTDGCETGISADVNNCGGCGVLCSANHVAPACVSGSCANGTCAAGYADCNANKQTDGCETDISSSLSSCGGCGIVCSTNHIGAQCMGGSCAAGLCAPGYADCNANKQTDGCETNISADLGNCGGCGVACSTNHITPACVGGSCASGTCAVEYADCNANKQTDGCETGISSNLSSCGGCGIVCSTDHITPACVGGSCASGTCAAGYGDCNANKQTDGCETDISSNLSNCGGCGIVCSTNHITPACVGGSCASGTCAAGYADCNANRQSDGCEVGIFTDRNNCGWCGHVCPIGYACNSGTCVCQPRTCASAGAECGSISDGCGGTLYCGSCGSGYTCQSGGCLKACPGGYQDCDGRCYRICP